MNFKHFFKGKNPTKHLTPKCPRPHSLPLSTWIRISASLKLIDFSSSETFPTSQTLMITQADTWSLFSRDSYKKYWFHLSSLREAFYMLQSYRSPFQVMEIFHAWLAPWDGPAPVKLTAGINPSAWQLHGAVEIFQNLTFKGRLLVWFDYLAGSFLSEKYDPFELISHVRMLLIIIINISFIFGFCS